VFAEDEAMESLIDLHNPEENLYVTDSKFFATEFAMGTKINAEF
jgi:hypothetical protein